jgi:hypothetical protein
MKEDQWQLSKKVIQDCKSALFSSDIKVTRSASMTLEIKNLVKSLENTDINLLLKAISGFINCFIKNNFSLSDLSTQGNWNDILEKSSDLLRTQEFIGFIQHSPIPNNALMQLLGLYHYVLARQELKEIEFTPKISVEDLVKNENLLLAAVKYHNFDALRYCYSHYGTWITSADKIQIKTYYNLLNDIFLKARQHNLLPVCLLMAEFNMYTFMTLGQKTSDSDEKDSTSDSDTMVCLLKESLQHLYLAKTITGHFSRDAKAIQHIKKYLSMQLKNTFGTDQLTYATQSEKTPIFMFTIPENFKKTYPINDYCEYVTQLSETHFRINFKHNKQLEAEKEAKNYYNFLTSETASKIPGYPDSMSYP